MKKKLILLLIIVLLYSNPFISAVNWNKFNQWSTIYNYVEEIITPSGLDATAKQFHNGIRYNFGFAITDDAPTRLTILIAEDYPYLKEIKRKILIAFALDKKIRINLQGYTNGGDRSAIYLFNNSDHYMRVEMYR